MYSYRRNLLVLATVLAVIPCLLPSAAKAQQPYASVLRHTYPSAQPEGSDIRYALFDSPASPKREVRAVWLTTIGGIDWPHSYAQSPRSIERQKQELRDILDRLQRAHINTVLLQTRIRATTIYPSHYEPWDGCLSGFPGTSPGYDALQYAIGECHKRGMELHAWIVTIPVGKWNKLGCQQLRKRYPGLIRRIGDEGYMNPEDYRTGDYLAGICSEITRNYDIDGIHLDYIRYPETWKIRVSRERGREYITSIVEKIHDAVKSLKPWVKMSCSPIGKYDDLSRYWSHGWNAYTKVCQDAQGWLRRGLMDELFPMMYFRDDQFFPFANDWKENDYGKIVVPGLGIYFLDPREGNWKIGDITREMYHLRTLRLGHAFFRSKFLTDNHQGIYDFTAGSFDVHPALVPAMTWGRHVPTGYTYNLYVSENAPVDTADARNLIAVKLTKEKADKALLLLRNRYYVVTRMDRYGIETITRRNDDVTSSSLRPAPFLENDGRKLLLPSKGNVLDADFVAVETLQGQLVSILPYQGRYADIRKINDGIYILRSINRKGKTHRLGTFMIRRR